MSDLGKKIEKLAIDKLFLIMSNREKYIEAWIAEPGYLSSKCVLEEREE